MKQQTTTIRTSAMTFVALAAAGLLAIGGLSLLQAQDSHAMTDRLLRDVSLTRAAGTTDMMHDGIRSNTLSALLAGADAQGAEKAAIHAELVEFLKNFSDALAAVEANASSAEVRAAVAEVKPVAERYGKTAELLVEAALTGAAAAAPLRVRFDEDFQLLADALETLSGLIQSEAQQVLADRDVMFVQARWIMLAAMLGTLGGLAVYGMRFARTLLMRLGAEPTDLRELAICIAGCDLTARFDRSGEHPNSVAAALMSMRDRLRDAVTAIRVEAEGVATGSEQIATGNQDLAQRTESQASNLQQTAASMEQMAGSLEQSAQHARAAHELATDASKLATRGGDAVHRVVATMSEIQQSSLRIADITNVIDGIAFQTNILALNAAVEAARAGEQGRGFAVVASEVRSLAQRSAAAAKEIKQLIGNSVDKVTTGNQSVAHAGATMGEIVAQVQRVNNLINEINVATQEQATGIGQVNQAVASLDQGTQQNATLVVEGAESARMLSDQAARLSRAVSIFRLEAA